MLQQLPTYDAMLRHSRNLPEVLRGRTVVIQFRAPVRDVALEQFYRIHLTAPMLAGGEEKFFQPEIIQPHRMRPRCRLCGARLSQTGATTFRCMQPGCTHEGRPSRLVTRVAGPMRGVVKVLTSFNATMGGKPVSVTFVVGREPVRTRGRVRMAELAKGALLVLDRRYHDAVLCAVYRTAGGICDQLGIRML